MVEKRIVSENPESDIWKALLRFSFPKNTEAFLLKSTGVKPTDEVVTSISSSMVQAEAYFRSAKAAPLDISPLLTYYGSINLLASTCSLLSGKKLGVQNHGAGLGMPDHLSKLGDVTITPSNSASGGIQVFANTFCPGVVLVNGCSWTLEELFGSIPDLKIDFENCYPSSKPYVIPVEVVKLRKKTYERVRNEDVAVFGSGFDWTQIKDFQKNYLAPQGTNDFVVLNRKINFQDCGITSISGRKYLEVGHKKGSLTSAPGIAIASLMGLYALGYLSRYRSETWSPFVRTDQSGERLLIERFLAVSQRQLPNLALNKIMGCDMRYVFEIDGVSDLTTTYTETDLQEIVEKKIAEITRSKGVTL